MAPGGPAFPVGPSLVASAGEAAVYAPANDELEFAKLIARLLDDPEERARMGAIGRDRISGELSWANSQKALLEAYAKARQ